MPENNSNFEDNSNQQPKKWFNVGNKTITVIWTLFLGYMIVIIYFYASYSDTTDPLPRQTVINDSQPQSQNTTLEDSLLAAVFNEYEAGNYDKARELTERLNTLFPGSVSAEHANTFMNNLEAPKKIEEIPIKTDLVQVDEEAPKDIIKKETSIRKKPKPQRQPTTVAKQYNDVAGSINNNTNSDANKALLTDAMSKMRKVIDAERDITWYYNKNISHYVYKNSFEIYIGTNNTGDVWLRMRSYYTGEKQLNIESFEVNVNDRDYPISTIYGKIERGKGSGGAWEWYDAQVSRKEIAMLEQVMQPGVTAIRYIGKNDVSERIMTEPEKLRIKHVMEMYYALLSQSAYISTAEF